MDNNMLNPGLVSPPRNNNGKERRNPSITPRKFRRFFTPRSRVPTHISSARKALQDLAAPSVNNRYQTPDPSSPIRPSSEDHAQDENFDRITTRSFKRRKYHHTPDSSPCRPGLLSPIRSLHSSQENIDLDLDESEDDELPTLSNPAKPLVPLVSRGFAGQLAQRQMGGMPRAGRSYMTFPTTDWRVDTADFYTAPDDAYRNTSNEGPGNCVPFCVASCHTNDLVAVGDEEGRVRLLETNPPKSQQSFQTPHLMFQSHSNAIIDLCFSEDDYRLATASGDQTGRILDMMTQTPIAVLQHHTASLKQVRFQPGSANGSVLATSSRDGSIRVWDLRCAGKPVQDTLVHPEQREDSLRFRRPSPKSGCAINSLHHAHARTYRQVQQGTGVEREDVPSRRELPGRTGDVSVTALQFLPSGQEHLLLSACEADASIKLWDIRSVHSSRRGVPSALSATAPPSSHENWRPFGISSLSLNTDGSRLYALCKDNTVYAYSTAHLILGHAPEMSTRNGEPPRRRHNAVTHQGLGPLYGFRHNSFHATSFYVKCAVRPVRDGRSELLAVGSSDRCAVLFPTQERYFRDALSYTMSNLTLENSTIAASTGGQLPPAKNRANNCLSARLVDDIPIVRMGTPLIRAHDNEVGSVAWTNEGKLVTIGDDFLVRRWYEDRERAKDLRTMDEFGGRRWCAGWADVEPDWDVDDEED
ncbi:WD40 repeat-like protein [Hypoxylon trugodes]|uniref:WD40 repeat-like protein n=1 Tax=Hypoxylon trugodes TaxID=326681 RepID=UPI002193034E|nr:WD40 repeat-like protein [Hypoxylon trugodes]KAI1391524.1 WD40 repeat-like protein [Hypoxylon trugodes]